MEWLSVSQLESLEALSLLAWLLKDTGWVLLLAPLAWPAAALAAAAEAAVLVATWKSSSVGGRVHRVATFAWLVANMVWMSSEFLFLPKEGVGRYLPWYDGPIAKVDEAAYKSGVHFAQCHLFLALAILGLFYASLARPSWWSSALEGSPQDGSIEEVTIAAGARGRVRGFDPEVYSLLFIGPWILKDIFWSFEVLVPALIAGLVVLCIMMDHVNQWGGVACWAEVCWVLGNMTWITAELLLNDVTHSPRNAAASLLAVGALLAAASLRNALRETSETTPLLHKAGAQASK